MSSLKLVSTIIDDRDPAIQYLPNASAWTGTHAEAAWRLYNNSDTFSTLQGAYIQYTFDGDAIEYWGNQGPDHGPCLVNIDGNDEQIVNSCAAHQDVPILLWTKGNLGRNQNHIIKISVVNASCPNVCEIDRFVVNKTISIVGSSESKTISIVGSSESKTTSIVGSSESSSGHSDGNNAPPWAAIGGAIGGATLLIALIGCCFCWYRKRNGRSRDLEDTTAHTSEPNDAKNTFVLLSTPADDSEKVGFGYGAKLEEAGTTAQGTLPIHLSAEGSNFESYQQPLPQIAPCSFSAAVNGEGAIRGALKEKKEAREEYMRAVAAGKAAYLLEQEAIDVFHASLSNIKPESELEIRIPFSLINQTSASPADSDSTAYPVSINLGSPSREPTGKFRLSKGSIYPHEFLEKEAVITISPQKLDKEHPNLVEGMQNNECLCDSNLLDQEYLFLVDRSSSMRGFPIAQVRTALNIMVKSIPNPPTITSFNIISFASHHDSLWQASKTYNEETISEAKMHIDSMHADYRGTKLHSALEYTFANMTTQQVNGKPIPVAVFVLTDGQAGDTHGMVATVSQAIAKAEGENRLLRVFVIGIGDGVSKDVCEGIARAGKGIAVYVGDHDIIHPELLHLVDEARSKDIKNYDTSRAPEERNSSSRPQTNRRQDTHDLQPAAIAVDGGEATHLVKVQIEPLRRRAGSPPVRDLEGRKIDRSRGQYSYLIIDAHTKKGVGLPEDHPIVGTTIPTTITSQGGFNSSLNGTNPTVEAIAAAQEFDGSFPLNDGFIRLLTGSSSAPSLPQELTALNGSEQEKQTIWITMIALAVLAKNLPGDRVSWKMLAEKAEKFVKASLISLGVDAAGAPAMMNLLRRAAAKYVSYRLWFPVLKDSNGSMIILIVSIDG